MSVADLPGNVDVTRVFTGTEEEQTRWIALSATFGTLYAI